MSVFILLLVFILSCKKAVDKEVMTKPVETPTIETTGDATVDAVGTDLNNIGEVEKDLSTDELNDVDAGLTDIQNI